MHLTAAPDRVVWFEGYVRTYLERDLQALSSIAALPDFRQLHAGGLSPARYTGTALER